MAPMKKVAMKMGGSKKLAAAAEEVQAKDDNPQNALRMDRNTPAGGGGMFPRPREGGTAWPMRPPGRGLPAWALPAPAQPAHPPDIASRPFQVADSCAVAALVEDAKGQKLPAALEKRKEVTSEEDGKPFAAR
eukprot:g16428.t1